MGQGQEPHQAWALSVFADDQDEDEEFQQSQLFSNDVLELDDLDGTHAVMVRTYRAGRGLLSWRENIRVQLDDPRQVLSFSEPQFPHIQ